MDHSSKNAEPVVEVIEPMPLEEVVATPGKKDKKPGRGRRALIWSGVITALIFVGGILAWNLGWYQAAVDRYNTGSIAIKVKEGDKFAVEGAEILVNGSRYTTDSTGKVSVAAIVAGVYPVSVTKDGYTPAKADMTVVRGENELFFINVEKVPDKLFILSGSVKDYVSGLPLTDVQVTIGSKSHKTDAAGGYSFEKMAAGEYTLTFSKSGYAEKQAIATVTDAALVVDATEIVPKGQIIFVSNREGGKRGLFVTNYDGSDQKVFVPRAGEGEDYGQSISPDGKWVVFSSTRDGIKNTYGNSVARLYIVARDGTGLKKVNDDISHSELRWSSHSRFLYYRAFSDSSESTTVFRFYDTQKNNVLDLGETGISEVAFSTDGNSVIYTLSKYAESGQPVYTNYLKFFNIATGDRNTFVTKIGNPFSSPTFTKDDKSIEYEQLVENIRKRYRMATLTLTEAEISLPAEDSKVYWPSPDGNLKAFLDVRDGKRDLFLVDKDGKNEKRLSKLGVVNQYLPLSWDDTGRYITFAVTREDENAIYIVSLDGGDPKKVTDFSAGSGYPGYY